MAKWINIDLHMHSQYSKKYDKDKVIEMSAKELVDTLLGKNIEIFSITDHDCFSANYYREILDYIKNKKISIIPGCEFNIYIEDNKKFQANFYFSPKSDLDTIENTIKDLYSDNKKPHFSEILDNLNKGKLDYIIFPEADKSSGIEKVYVKIRELNQLDRLLKNGMQRIFKAYDSTDSFNKFSADMWAMSYYKATEEFKKIVKKFSDKELNYFTGEIKDYLKNGIEPVKYIEDVKTIAKTISDYGECFTYFHFSDWHNKSKYNPEYQNYIFGNIDLPFESLEMAVLDPISRVKILKINESLPKPINSIKEISFKINDKDYTIEFETGLNAIVGKRASGKSLLMSVLLKLYDKNSIELDKYKKYYNIDINSIKCKLYSGEEVGLGQLNSLEYIKQNDISSIFENPDYMSSTLNKYYVNLEEPDYTNYNRIISYLKIIKPYNINYKNVSQYINNIESFNSYTLSILEKINSNEINNFYKELIEKYNGLIQSIEKAGFSTINFKRYKNWIEREKILLDKKISIYNELINESNLEIAKLNSKNTEKMERTKMVVEQYNDSLNIICDNFNTLLNYKELEYLINNFDINLPEKKINQKNSFVFINEFKYKNGNNLKTNLIDNITYNIIKRGCPDTDIGLIKAYIEGRTVLKSSSKNLFDNIQKKFISDNLIQEKTMYQFKNDNLSTLINNIDDFNKNKDNLENISSSSLGRKSIAYLEFMFDTNASILMFDQPEDNIDNDYISKVLVPLIKHKKKSKQLIFITHNPSVAVYADAFNYIYASNLNGDISYKNLYIESVDDKKEILNILDGGSPSFSNRNLKYGNIVGEFKYGNKD